MALEAVIFDLDDTLIVEEATARASLRLALELVACADPEEAEDRVLAAIREVWWAGPHHGLALELGIASWEGLWSRLEGCHHRLDGLRAWLPVYRQEAWRAALAGLGVDDPVLAGAVAEAYEENQRAGHPVIEGAAEAVRHAAARWRTGLLTNGPTDIQGLKLNQSGLAACFGAVVISGRAGVGKPSPEAFGAALGALGVAAGDAVMVGDSWERDVLGALAAGVAPVWISGTRRTPDPDLPVRVIPSIEALPGLLEAGAGAGQSP